MLKRILVPLDGSPVAEHAIPVAARLARAEGATIVLVRVVRASIEYESALRATTSWVPAADLQERDEATRYLTEKQGRDDLSGIATERHVYAGAAGPVIRATAQSGAVDLIVMTQRGRGGLTRLVLGSVTAEVVRTTSIPVLVLRGGEALLEQREPSPTDTTATSPIVTLVALDGSPLAEAALEPAIQLTTALSRPARPALHLLRVVDLGRGPGVSVFSASIPDTMQRLSEARDREVGEAERYLSDLAARLRTREQGEPRLSVSWSVERSLDIADAIVSASKGSSQGREDCDLIALATHGRGGLRRWLVGSVTEAVLRRAEVPVLSVRPQGAPPPPESEVGEEASTANSAPPTS